MSATRPVTFRATPETPCPVCGRTSSCSATDDGLRFCRAAPPRPGWACLSRGADDNGFHHYRPADEPRETRPVPPPRPAPPAADVTAVAERYARALTPERRDQLAAALGLPAEALAAFPLLGFRADDPHGPCWTCPESGGDGTVRGLLRRYLDPAVEKKLMFQHRHGLYIPAGWDKRPGPAVAPEGISDLLALLACGLTGVGRPSNTGGLDPLAEVFDGTERELIILGENDRKRNGEWPGGAGAKVAEKLARRLGVPVAFRLPPPNCKDAREWVHRLAAATDGPPDYARFGRVILERLRSPEEPPVARDGVFDAFRDRSTLDDVVQLLEQKGHTLTARSEDRAEFTRTENEEPFRVQLVGGVPITFGLSTGDGPPAAEGLDPAELLCWLRGGSLGPPAMAELATALRKHLEWPEPPADLFDAPPADETPPTDTTPPAGDGPALEVVVTAVATGRAGVSLVTAAADGRELVRDTLDLNALARRTAFANAALKALFPGVPAKSWPPEARTAIEAQLLRWARVPPKAAAAEPPAPAASTTPGGYSVLDGQTYHDGRFGRVRLANFAARIVGETVCDDGAERTRELALAVTRAGAADAAAVAVPVERFAGMDWVAERLGPGFVIQAGPGVRDHLRCAIQELSAAQIPTETAYRHTGWREIGGGWRYLHAATADGVTVRLDGSAGRFALPEPPAGDRLRAAVRASLGLLDGLAPDRVTFPLLASVYRAALGPADYALWLVGRTGSYKSELAALAQQHYGAAMARMNLPGSWSSTPNALEELAFTLKDALLVVDDFAPPAGRLDADRLHAAADRLLRGQGNGAGRGRLRPDGTPRPPRPSRGLILATGEDVPRGQSIQARLGVVEVRRGDVNTARLTACQRDAAGGLYAEALAGFVAWLAPRFAEVAAELPGLRAELRDRYADLSGHARAPDVIANLLAGLHHLLAFAQAAGAVTRPESLALWRRGLEAVTTVAEDLREQGRAADPVEQFPALLSAVISGGIGHVADRAGGRPEHGGSWGWDERTGAPRGMKIGWLRRAEVCLDPDTAYAALFELCRRQGQGYPLSKDQLFRRLKDNGTLFHCEERRTTCRRTLENANRAVAVVSTDLFSREPDGTDLQLWHEEEEDESRPGAA